MNGFEIKLLTGGRSFVYSIPFDNEDEYPEIIGTFLDEVEQAILDMLAVRTYEKEFNNLDEGEQRVIREYLKRSIPDDE